MTEATFTTGKGAQAPDPAAAPRDIRVWDPLVRLIHWSVAAGVFVNAAVTDPEKQPHELVGYAILALVLLRLVWGLMGPRPARFTSFPPNPLAALRHLWGLFHGARGVHLSHNPAGALMVYNLWATLIGMGATGIMMTTPRYFGIEWVEEAHEALFAWLMLSVALHIAGVLLDTALTRVNLVRAMLDGRKRLPPQGPAG
ncbi:MAG: cytochrome b/b6 domain-containing protein [Maritimibacter sp.]|nr:cytochrome b/b6 domain-containing protein [Maritimibacter sp.]